MKRRQFLAALTSATGLALVFAILVVVQVLIRNVPWRRDFTEEKLYTLSAATREFLAKLPTDVTLKLYFSRSEEAVPMNLKQYAQRLTDLLREYERYGRGRIQLEIYDPKPDSEEEEWATRYGLSAQGVNVLGGPKIFLGLVAVSGTKEASIPFLAPAMEPQVEYLVTRLINEVTLARRPRVGVLSSLPIMGETDSPPALRRSQEAKAWMVVEELKRMYEVVSVPNTSSNLPPDLDLLVVVHPRELPEALLYAIDQYVMKGGRMLAFVDPWCIAQQETAREPKAGYWMPSSDLNRLTITWGAELASGELVASLSQATEISRGDGTIERSPIWLSLRDEALDRKEMATFPLKLVMMIFPGGFRLSVTNEVKATVLLSSADDGGWVDSFAATMDPGGGFRNFRREGKLPLAVRLEGNFKSAFPAGPPRSSGEQAPTGSVHLAESEKPGTVVLVADVDMLYDRFAVRTMNFFGFQLYQPINDNLALFMNLVEQMAGNEALIRLRSRSTYDRPFHRVIALQTQAQQRWREEEMALQAELEETERRLNELQAQKSPDQQFILSPEQKAMIEQFRMKQLETQRKLKAVRKKLREDIDALGFRLKVINMAAMPTLVAAYGLFHGWRRRKKALQKSS